MNAIDVAIIIVSHFSLISYTTSHLLEGASSFAAKYKTQPKNLLALAFGISFRTMRLGGGGAKAGVWQNLWT